MKVCIPCTEADREHGRLSVPFDDAPVFAFWDPATDDITFESNPLVGRDDACACAITRWARKIEADVFISADLGRRAARRLITAGVETLQAPIGTVANVLQQYRSGVLSPTPTGMRSGSCCEHAGNHPHQHREGACCGQGHHGDHHTHRCGKNG